MCSFLNFASCSFYKKTIDALPNSEIVKRSYLHDVRLRGLAVAVPDKGCKTFILFLVNQKESLGRYILT